MKKFVLIIACFLLLCSHDMYLKMDRFFIVPNQEATIKLYNGTFEKSDNVIDRDRMIDASLVGNGKRIAVAHDEWTEKDSTTLLHFKSGDPGTWVAGLSTKARNIEMDAEAFNNYLIHDGIKDMLAQRKENNTLNANAIEEYSKHVKAIFQVGDKTTTDWQTELGYPIEFIPLSNPYEAYTGDTLRVKLLRDGQPLANQLVHADFKPSEHGHSHEESTHAHGNKEQSHTHSEEEGEHSHDNSTHTHTKQDATPTHTHGEAEGQHTHTHEKTKDTQEHSHGDEPHDHDKEATHTQDIAQEEDTSHTHTTGQELRTNDQGVVSVRLTDDGFWYLRTIHLVTTEAQGLTHKSNWATLTFEITHSHGDSHDHEHSDATHQHDDEFPSYLFWIGSLVILGGLFFLFNKKKK